MEAIKIHGVQKLKVSNKKRRTTQKTSTEILGGMVPRIIWSFLGQFFEVFLSLKVACYPNIFTFAALTSQVYHSGKLTKIAMENPPFSMVFTNETWGFSMVMS